MTSLYAIWIPTLVVSHCIGLLLLLYSLEQVGGHVSKTFAKFFGSKKEEKLPEAVNIDVKAFVPGIQELDDDPLMSTKKKIVCAAEAPHPIKLEWSNISYEVRDNKTMEMKTVLHDCCGNCNPGETVALMGPSGAAYVPQEDSFVATMTVEETLAFRTDLSVPKSVGNIEKVERIAFVLKTMGLIRVKDTKVGGLLPGGIVVRGISGGEKRRLSIACALISNPSILFLDEPTTGLDSFAALTVMDYMSQLASEGRSIIASIHQPRIDIFDRFHKVSILSEGRLLYHGKPSGSVTWFREGINLSYLQSRDGPVPDWIMDCVSIGFTKPPAIASRTLTSLSQVEAAAALFKEHRNLCSLEFASSDEPSDIVDNEDTKIKAKVLTTYVPKGDVVENNNSEISTKKFAVSWFVQYKVLLKRALLAQLRNPTDTSSRLLMSTWIGTLAGLVYDSLDEGSSFANQRLALMFFLLLLYQLMPFCFMSFYVADRRFYQADVAAGLYSTSAYYLAAMTASAPFFVLNSIVGGLMGYGLAGLRYSGHSILLFMTVLALQSLVSNQLQVFCVWVTPNQDLAYTLSTGYVAASILLSGFYIRIHTIKIGFIKGLSWLSYNKYAMAAMGRIELKGVNWNPSTCGDSDYDPALPGNLNNCILKGDEILNYYGYTTDTAIQIAALLAAYIIFHIGSYFALSRLYRGK